MFTRLTAILLATFTVASPSQASWDTRFWPASEKNVRFQISTNETGIGNWVFQADIVTSNLISALQERHEAVFLDRFDGSQSILYYIPRRPDNSLQAIKDAVEVLVPYFLDQTKFPSSYDPTSAIITNLHYWSVTSILAHCELPTNFFDYTPPRNLAGHIGTGSAHWTNSASYGWDATRKVLTNLIYTYQTAGILKTKETKKYSSGTDQIYLNYGLPRIYDNCDFSQSITDYDFGNMTISNFLPAAYWYDDYWANGYFIGDQSYYYSEYTNNIVSGRPAFQVGHINTVSLTNGMHIGFSFSKVDGGLYYGDFCQKPYPPIWTRTNDNYTACLFTNACDWVYVSQIAPTAPVELSDGSLFVAANNVVSAPNTGCSVMQFLTEVENGDEFVPDPSLIPCVGEVDSVFWNVGYAAGATTEIPLEYNRRYSHIIKWDFQYD